jgi:hypothetical protein
MSIRLGAAHVFLRCMGMILACSATAIGPAYGYSGPIEHPYMPVPQDDPSTTGSAAPGGKSPQEGEGKPKDDAPRSLDDLLGIPSTDSKSGEAAADRSSDRRLEQSLDGVNMQDLVVRAMDGMREAARRLGQDRDAGLGTQRIQQDIVTTLDRLLAEAQKQQQSSKGSSRSRSRQQSQSSDDDPSERNGQSASSSARSESSAASASSEPGSDESTGQRPADEAAVSGAELDESRVEWGRLPERVRELILQGRRDRVSTLYERITREYYRRLAEEASR